MFYYLYYLFGYVKDEEEDIKKVDEVEGYEVVIKSKDHTYFKKTFDKNLQYKNVVDELKKVLTPKDY